MRKKRILITGITGQDGSYLAEHHLELGNEVYGIIRRQSVTENQQSRLDHLRGKITVFYGDLLDVSSLQRILTDVMPDEIYNLAAMSHVSVSFDVPQFVIQTNTLGVLNLLESVKLICPKSKLYQASSSEMFGLNVDDDKFQRETTSFNPTSPYGISKVAAYHLIRHYRRAYGMFAVNGILFNHSSVSEFTPVIIKENNEIDIKSISEVVNRHSNKNIESVNKNLLAHQTIDVVNDFEIWDKDGWVKVTCASAYPHKKEDPKKPSFIISKNSAYFVTDDHECIMEDLSEKKAKNIEVGDKVSLIPYPENENTKTSISENEAELLGFIVGDGHYNIKENKTSLANKDTEILDYFANIWANDLNGTIGKYKAKSDVWSYRLNKNKTWTRQFDIYTEDKYKRVPKIVLNSSIEIQKAFLIGYNKADGLKKNPCIYLFKNFRTNSHVLAAGLLYLLNNTTKQRYNINIDYKVIKGTRAYYYSINILSDSDNGQNHQNSYSNYLEVKNLLNEKISQREISRITGISRLFIRKILNGYIPDNVHHLEKVNAEIKKIIPHNDYKGWFYDLETTSGTFHAGVGQGHIHNSPRRGSNFVIAKVVKAASRIKLGLQEKLELGNMDTYRDFGHSKDYTKGMIAIMNHSEPDDFVLSTMETYSVRDVCEVAFSYLAMSYKDYVVQNPKYMRPEELPYLRGDSTKVREVLGWKPEYDFKMLVHEMIDHWMDILQGKKSLR